MSRKPVAKKKTGKKPTIATMKGGIIVGGSIMAGRDVVFGDVAGRDVIGRDQINISIILRMGAFTPPPDMQQLRADYLAHVRHSYRALDFKGIPQFDALSHELLLEDVYVPLLVRPELLVSETWERRLAGRAFGLEISSNERSVTGQVGLVSVRVEEALAEESRVIILGDPGSGKTTLLRHLALRLAAEDGAPLPILVPLNAFAEALSQADCSLQRYLPEYYASLAQGIASLAPLFDSAIAQGHAVILLDGLDEVQQQRQLLVNKVEVFAREAAARGNRVIVTSHIVGYRESPLNPTEWTLYTLLDLDHEAIEQFANKWCVAFETSTLGDIPEARTSAERERASLLEVIDANPGVANLASNPLMLTILALIKRQGVSLPHRRVQLYELYLETLLSAWSKARALDKRQVGPDMDYLQILMILGPLALWLREENPTAGLISEQALLGWLTNCFMGEDWGLPRDSAAERARMFLENVRHYTSLILERGQGQYGFIHLTFEEMLAAHGLVQAGQLRLEDSLHIIRRHFADPAWRETVLLSVGVWGLLNQQPRVAGEVVRAMLQMECAGADAGQNVLLAGACLEDVGELGLGRIAAAEVIKALLDTAHNRLLPPVVQRDAGFTLGRAGWTPPDLDAFISIPAGQFLYGDEKRMVDVKQPFAIGKYPVTNRQYRRFMEADGYNRREFWSDMGWAWRMGMYDSQARRDYEERYLALRPREKRGEPLYWRDVKWNNPLAPVVGVCWFEAEAYCNWLAKELGQPIRLPTEEEWERASRHIDGREYPWGNTFDRNRLNCAEFWSGESELSNFTKLSDWWQSNSFKTISTTVVGQFSDGGSPLGVSDMCGNVWEWTDSWYDADKIYLTVRGGSWLNLSRFARCSSRYGFVPDYFSPDVGFRVLSPGSFSAL